MKQFFAFLMFVAVSTVSFAQNIQNNPTSNHGNKFEQLGTILATPNEYRTASGAPGPKYWQQRADYNIKCELDEANLKLKGSETITYFNNSPDALTYLWLQLDENEHNTLNKADFQDGSSLRQVSEASIKALEDAKKDNGYGHIISKITDATGKSLKYTINQTMMRIDLPTTLLPGQKFVLNIVWCLEVEADMNFSLKMEIAYLPWCNGSQDFVYTLIFRDGKIINLLEEANLL
jgi:hypothetical protein